MPRSARLEPKVGDRIELRVVDASLASALYHGIPSARLLAHARLASGDEASWDERLAHLLAVRPDVLDRVRRAIGRHLRSAVDERPIRGTSDASVQGTLAVLAWAVASDPEGDASLAEVAPSSGKVTCDAAVLAACAAYDARLATPTRDRRAPAFEACIRLSTRATLGPMPWEKLQAIATQLDRPEIGVVLFGATKPSGSIFPRRVDDEIPAQDRRMDAIDRAPFDALLARDPRQLGPALWRSEQSVGGSSIPLASFLSDLARLLRHPGDLIAALAAPDPSEGLTHDPGGTRSWAPPLEWTTAHASALADMVERGITPVSSVRTSVLRGGEAALDAIGAEMLHASNHPAASAAFAEVVARNARPRDIPRSVTYFAVAPDPEPAARALGACVDAELPRVLGAWLEAMLPMDGDEAGASSASRVSACIASLKPYAQLYDAVEPLKNRLPNRASPAR